MVKPDADGPSAESSLPARQRKWHPRVFTGCVNCRRRHVKCDERTQSCSNCTRLNMPCNFDRRFVFKAVRLSSRPAAGKRRPTASTSASSSASGLDDDAFAYDAAHDAAQALSRDLVAAAPPGSPGFVVTSNMAATGPVWGVDSAFAVARPDPAARLDCHDSLYYQHFLRTVSSYLIIYDTPTNANPYRLLPQLTDSSGLLQDTMRALGAMHLSGVPGVSNQRLHRSAAMKTYASIVTRLRGTVSSQRASASLELLATSLLLCMLEQVSSSDATWKTHLLGAEQVFRSMYSPSTSSAASVVVDDPGTAATVPLRRFLISMMSYLDVAAACATGEGPLIPGDYWETLGGGWQYNLGVPSLAKARSAVDRIMAQLRTSWSRAMLIQIEISRFAKALRLGMDRPSKEMLYADLAYRIHSWHESAPDIYQLLEGMDSMPADASRDDVEAFRGAACIQCYVLACSIYLERVASRRVAGAALKPEIKAAVDRIMTLTHNFASGIHRLAMLWPLFTVGIATVDPEQQAVLSDWLTELKSFGFKGCTPPKHVSRVLDTLEYSWAHVRLNGGLNYAEFESMISRNLVP